MNVTIILYSGENWGICSDSHALYNFHYTKYSDIHLACSIQCFMLAGNGLGTCKATLYHVHARILSIWIGVAWGWGYIYGYARLYILWICMHQPWLSQQLCIIVTVYLVYRMILCGLCCMIMQYILYCMHAAWAQVHAVWLLQIHITCTILLCVILWYMQFENIPDDTTVILIVFPAAPEVNSFVLKEVRLTFLNFWAYSSYSYSYS